MTETDMEERVTERAYHRIVGEAGITRLRQR
jgi:hypothetical protein